MSTQPINKNYQNDVVSKQSDVLDEDELTLEDLGSHPILERVAQRIESNVRSLSHTAHNSHYSSNT